MTLPWLSLSLVKGEANWEGHGGHVVIREGGMQAKVGRAGFWKGWFIGKNPL